MHQTAISKTKVGIVFEGLLLGYFTEIFDPHRTREMHFPLFYCCIWIKLKQILMCWPKSYNAMIIGEGGSLFKICHVTQIIAGASLPPTPSFLHFTPLTTPPPWEGIFCVPSFPPSAIYLHPVVSALDFHGKMKVEAGQIFFIRVALSTLPIIENSTHSCFLSRLFSTMWQKVTLHHDTWW